MGGQTLFLPCGEGYDIDQSVWDAAFAIRLRDAREIVLTGSTESELRPVMEALRRSPVIPKNVRIGYRIERRQAA